MVTGEVSQPAWVTDSVPCRPVGRRTQGLGGLAVAGSSSAAEGSAGSVGEGESVDGVAGDVESAAVEQVVASDAQADEEIEVGGAAQRPPEGVMGRTARCARRSSDSVAAGLRPGASLAPLGRHLADSVWSCPWESVRHEIA